MKAKLVRVSRWLAVELPDDIVRQLQLRKGDTVDVSVDKQSGVITITAEQRRTTLNDRY